MPLARVPLGPPGNVDARPLPLLRALFARLDAARVPWVALRGLDAWPDGVNGGDVDLAVAPESLGALGQLAVEASRAAGFQVLEWFVGAGWVQARFVRPGAPDEPPVFVQVDLHAAEQWRGLPTIDLRPVLAEAERDGELLRPRAEHRAVVDWLPALLHRGAAKPARTDALARVARQRPEAVQTLLATGFGPALARTLVDRLTRGDPCDALVPALRRALVWRLREASARDGFTANVRAALAWRRRALPDGHGLVIALVGPDGCGKSTVAAAVARLLGQAFPTAEPLHLHLRPHLLPDLAVLFRAGRRSKAAVAVDTPHALPPAGQLSSAVRVTYYGLDYLLGWWSAVLPRARFQRAAVVFERYVFDVLVDPRRLRLDLPLGLRDALARGAPRPDAVVLLDAPVAVIHARKAELPEAEIARQLTAYRALIGRLPEGSVVDANKSPERVAWEVVRRAVQRKVEATERRLAGTRGNPT